MKIKKIFKHLRSAMKESNPEGNPGAMVVMNEKKNQAVIYVQGKTAIKDVIKGIDKASYSECDCPECRAEREMSEIADDVAMAGMEEAVAEAIHKSNMTPSGKIRAVKAVAKILNEI